MIGGIQMDDARARLDRAMNDQRLELRLRWVEVARRARMSVQNLSLIRKGKIDITDLAAANLEEAFEWDRGRIKDILQDGDSAPVDPLTGPTGEIGRMVEAYRKRHGPDAAGKLLQELIQANIQAAQKSHEHPATSTDAEQLPSRRPYG